MESFFMRGLLQSELVSEHLHPHSTPQPCLRRIQLAPET
jgi:hypothetical protein